MSIQLINEEQTNKRVRSILKKQPKIENHKSRSNSEERQYILEEPEHHEDEEKERIELYPHLYQTREIFCALTDHTTRNPPDEALYIPVQQVGTTLLR